MSEVLEVQDSARTEPKRWEDRYLHGVQGLRTVAALLVASYHIWFHRVSGGVDVFFVVSGFFTAKSLIRWSSVTSLREVGRKLGQYWARTARRVIPSAMLVILVTVIMCVLWMPVTAWDEAIPHGLASTLFYENWHLIGTGSDYNQWGSMTSPFQQFWALSIQVQSYILVPLIALAGLVVARAFRKKALHAVVVTLSLAASASLLYSVYFTHVDQQASYFSLATRLWEFLAGSLLFLALSRWRGGGRFAPILGWAGLLVVMFYGALLDLSTLLPGYHAVPLIAGTAALIFSAIHGREPGILKQKWILAFADASFTFYLWHWPILVFYRWRFGNDVGFVSGVGILALSAFLAYVTTKWYERPIRYSRFLKKSALATAIVSALMVAPVLGALAWWNSQAHSQTKEALAGGGTSAPGEASRSVEADNGGDYDFYPSPLQAKEMWLTAHKRPPAEQAPCVQADDETDLIICDWVISTESDKRIVVLGGSHEYQWIDAVSEIGVEAGVNVESMSKIRCHMADGVHPPCIEWYEEALDELLAHPPQVVVMTATRTSEEGPEEVTPRKAEAAKKLVDAGVQVVALRDNPRFELPVPYCVDLNGVEACGRDAEGVYAPRDDLGLPVMDGYQFVDYSDRWCPGDTCPVVLEGILAYVDANHIGSHWATANKDRLEVAVLRALVRAA